MINGSLYGLLNNGDRAPTNEVIVYELHEILTQTFPLKAFANVSPFVSNIAFGSGDDICFQACGMVC